MADWVWDTFEYSCFLEVKGCGSFRLTLMLYFLLGCKKDCRTYLYKPHEVCETSGENSYEKRKKNQEIYKDLRKIMEEISWFFLPLDAIIKSARCYNRYGFMEPWEHTFISQTNK